MTITVYKNGQIIYHAVNTNRIVNFDDGGVRIYSEWNNKSYQQKEFEKKDYDWYEVGEK